MTPSQLARELSALVAKATGSETQWREQRVTAHEYSVLIGAISSRLYKLRDEAISNEIDARRRIAAGGAL